MDVRHWTEQEFLDRVYGIGGGDEAHLDSCTECRARWAGVSERRKAITAEPEVSPLFLAAQRRAIHGRLNQRSRNPLIFAPAMAAVAMVAVGVWLYPGKEVSPVPQPKTDDAVFAEVYSLEQSSLPEAASPVRALFEEN